MTSNYPPGVSELPGDGEIEQEYLFEFNGEIVVSAYSEEGAEETFYNNLKELILEGKADGTIEIE